MQPGAEDETDDAAIAGLMKRAFASHATDRSSPGGAAGIGAGASDGDGAPEGGDADDADDACGSLFGALHFLMAGGAPAAAPAPVLPLAECDDHTCACPMDVMVRLPASVAGGGDDGHTYPRYSSRGGVQGSGAGGAAGPTSAAAAAAQQQDLLLTSTTIASVDEAGDAAGSAGIGGCPGERESQAGPIGVASASSSPRSAVRTRPRLLLRRNSELRLASGGAGAGTCAAAPSGGFPALIRSALLGSQQHQQQQGAAPAPPATPASAGLAGIRNAASMRGMMTPQAPAGGNGNAASWYSQPDQISRMASISNSMHDADMAAALAAANGSLAGSQPRSSRNSNNPSPRVTGLIGTSTFGLGPSLGLAAGTGAASPVRCAAGSMAGMVTLSGWANSRSKQNVLLPPPASRSPAAVAVVAVPRPLVESAEALLACSESSWQFDSFELAEATCGHPLSVLGFFLLQRSQLISRFKLDGAKLARFLQVRRLAVAWQMMQLLRTPNQRRLRCLQAGCMSVQVLGHMRWLRGHFGPGASSCASFAACTAQACEGVAAAQAGRPCAPLRSHIGGLRCAMLGYVLCCAVLGANQPHPRAPTPGAADGGGGLPGGQPLPQRDARGRRPAQRPRAAASGRHGGAAGGVNAGPVGGAVRLLYHWLYRCTARPLCRPAWPAWPAFMSAGEGWVCGGGRGDEEGQAVCGLGVGGGGG